MGSDCLWVRRVSFCYDDSVLQLARGVIVQHSEYTKNYWIECFKIVNFIVYELYQLKMLEQKWKGIQSILILSGLWSFYQMKTDPLASGVSNMSSIWECLSK